MWKWLHPYAKAETAYNLCYKLLPYFAWLAGITFVVGSVWGMVFAPSDYQQGESYRIIFYHVPSAIWSMGAYSSMAVCALVGMVWQIRNAELAVYAIAPIGAVFTMMALITGAIWGKPMWGTWWVWDARLTAQLIQLFLYLGIIVLYNAFEDKRTGARAASILAVVGWVNVPIIHYSVEWWNTLHQGATITKFDKPSISSDMLWPLLLTLASFFFIFAALTCLRLANQIILNDARRPWVKQLIDKNDRSES